MSRRRGGKNCRIGCCQGRRFLMWCDIRLSPTRICRLLRLEQFRRVGESDAIDGSHGHADRSKLASSARVPATVCAPFAWGPEWKGCGVTRTAVRSAGALIASEVNVRCDVDGDDPRRLPLRTARPPRLSRRGRWHCPTRAVAAAV